MAAGAIEGHSHLACVQFAEQQQATTTTATIFPPSSPPRLRERATTTKQLVVPAEAKSSTNAIRDAEFIALTDSSEFIRD